MVVSLDIDGKRHDNPGPADIARAFAELRQGKGFFSGPGITIAILARDPVHVLTASGTRDAGFMLSYQDGNCEYNAGPDQAVTLDKVVQIFQLYARDENWGQDNFKWERSEMIDKKTLTKRFLIIAILGVLAIMVVKKLVGR